MPLFIDPTKELGALDEKQLRETAARFEAKIFGRKKNLRGAGFVASIAALTAGFVAYAYIGISLLAPLMVPAALCAGLSVFVLNSRHDQECYSEARRLREAADNREQMVNLARQAAEELPQKATVLQAPTIVRGPLRLKKAPSPKFT